MFNPARLNTLRAAADAAAKALEETLPTGSLFQIPLYAGAVFQVLDIRSYSPSGVEKGPTRGAWKIGQFDKGVYDGSNPDRATIHYFRADRSVRHIRGEQAERLIDQTTPNSGFPRAVWNTPEVGGKSINSCQSSPSRT